MQAWLFLLFASLVGGIINVVTMAQIGAALATTIGIGGGIAQNIEVEVRRAVRRFLISATFTVCIALALIFVGLSIPYTTGSNILADIGNALLGAILIGATLAATTSFSGALPPSILAGLRQTLRRFLIYFAVALVVSLVLVVIGHALPLGSSSRFFAKSLFIAGGSVLFGAFLVITLYFGVFLANAITFALDTLHQFLYFIARVVVAILRVFQLAETVAPRGQVAQGLANWIDVVLTIPPLLWCFFTCFLICWPTWIGAGVALIASAFMLGFFIVGHKLRVPTRFWSWTYRFILPTFFLVWVLRAFFPGVVLIAVNSAVHAARVVSCKFDSSTTFCKERKLKQIAVGLRDVMSSAEDVAEEATHGSGSVTVVTVGFFYKALNVAVVVALLMTTALVLSGIIRWFLAKKDDVAEITKARQAIVSGIVAGVVALGIALSKSYFI